MAKEIEKLDDDFEELDFDFDDSEFGDFFNEAPPKTGREALSSTLKNAGSSFVEEFNVANVDNITKLLEKAIPEKLKTNVDDLVDIKDSLFKEIKAHGPSIRANTNKLISLTEKYLPKGGMIEHGLTKLREAVGTDEEGNRSTEPSKEEILNDKLVNMLQSTIDEKSTKEHYEEKLKETLDYKKNLNTLQIQNFINANLERMNSYNVDVTTSYYRKSLELQFRQLDTAMEMLTVNKVSSDTIKNQLETIVKNTALPDAVKLRSTEVISMLAKNKMAEAGMDAMFGEGTKFDKIKKKALGKVSTIIQGLEETLAEAAGMGEMADMMREQSAQFGGGGGMGSIAGSLAADWVKDKLGDKISKKLASTKLGSKIFGNIQDVMTDPSEYFKEKVDKSYESEDKDTWKEKLKRTFFSNMADITKNDFSEQVVSLAKPNMDESAIYTNRTDTTINKTIPTILSEILQETTSIYQVLSKSTGVDNRAEKRIYDTDTDSMVTEKETKDKISSKLSNAVKKGGGNWNIKRATDLLMKDSKFKFDPEERAQLEKSIMEHMMEGGNVSSKMFKDKEFLKRLKDPKLIKRAMRLNQQFENRGDAFDVANNKREVSDYLSKAISSVKNPKNIINEFRDKGNLDLLRQMGLVDVDNETGGVSVNSKKYKELVGDSFYKESLKEHKGENRREVVKPINKETQELLDSVKDIDLKESFKESDLGKKVSKNIKKVKRFAKSKKPIKDIIKAKDKVVDELTGDNLEKNLELLGQELTKDNLKKRATQAYDFAVDQTSEEKMKERKKQVKEFASTAKIKANKAKEFIKEETKKENLIKREKDIRKWIDEEVTIENAKEVKDNILEEFNKSKIKGMVDKKVEESTVAKIIDENVQAAMETGKAISKSKLVDNILREVNSGADTVKSSELFKKTTEKATDIRNDILNVKINDKTVSEIIEDVNSKKDEILNTPDDTSNKIEKEKENKIPLSERKTFIESAVDNIDKLTEKVKLISKVQEDTVDNIISSNKESIAKELKEGNDDTDELVIVNTADLDSNLDIKDLKDKDKTTGFRKIVNKFKKALKIDTPKDSKDSIAPIETKDDLVYDDLIDNKNDNSKDDKNNKDNPKLTLVEKISELIESLKGNKESIDENSDALEKSKKDTGSKFAFNDTNKDGVREGSWKDKIKSMAKTTMDRVTGKSDKKDTSEDKDKKSLWSYIQMLLPFGGLLTTLISGVTGILSTVTTFGKGVFGLVSALSTVTRFVGKGIIGPIFKLISGLVPGLLKMGIDVSTGALGAGWKGLKKFVNMSAVTKGAEKKVLGSLAKNVGKRALAKIPGLGIAAGAYLGYDYLKEGDTVGALGTWASTLISQIPVIGTGAGLAMDAWLMKRDMDKEEAGTDKEEEAVDQEATEKEEKRKEEEKKAQEEWSQNEDNIKKQLNQYENKYEDIEKEKEDIEKEETNKAEQTASSNTTATNKFDGTEENKIDPGKQQTLDDIDRQRAAIQAKLQAANPNSQFQSTTGRGRYNAYGSFGKSSATTGDRFAIADEPMSYKNVVGASKDEVKKLIVENSKKAGMNPNIMLTMAAKESGMNPNSKSPTSTATGLFQFLNDTWRDVVRNYGAKYGLTPENANRLNPEHSTLMAAEYLKQNLAPIKQVKGNINATDAYLTHFLGPGGARKFLSASPSAPSSIMGDAVVKANSTIFTDGGRIRTIGEVYQVLAKQLKKTADQFGISGVIENKFTSGGEVDNTTANVTGGSSSAPSATAKGEKGLTGVADPFAVNPSEKKTPATNQVINNNASNNVKPPVTNTYSSKGITNTPMNVSNAQQYTSQMDTSMNDTMMKSAVKQSIELSSANSKQLDNIVANTKTIADNTAGANKLLTDIKDLLGKVNLSNPATSAEANTGNATNNVRPPEKETKEVVSTGRGGSMSSYFGNTNKFFD